MIITETRPDEDDELLPVTRVCSDVPERRSGNLDEELPLRRLRRKLNSRPRKIVVENNKPRSSACRDKLDLLLHDNCLTQELSARFD